MARPFAVSLSAISKQLRVLERAGVLSQAKQGRIRRCHLEVEPMREAVEWRERYRRYWEEQLDSLANYINQLQNEEEQP